MRRVAETILIGATLLGAGVIAAQAQGPASGGSPRETIDGGAVLEPGGSPEAGRKARPSNPTLRETPPAPPTTGQRPPSPGEIAPPVGRVPPNAPVLREK